MTTGTDHPSWNKILSRLVLLHVLIVMGNAFAHEKLGTLYFVRDHLPILVVLMLFPLIAVWMYEKALRRPGLILLNGGISAALLYNMYDRFIADQGTVFFPPPLPWKILYEASFGTLLTLEALLLWYGIQILREWHSRENHQ